MTKKQKTVLYRIIASAILILGISILCEFVDVNIWGQVVLYLIPYFVIGYDILRKAFKGILNKQVFDENFLMAIATVGAMLLGEFKEGVAVMLFYQIGELFQSCAVGKSRRNIAALMDIRPDYANIIVDGQIEQVDPDDVEIGTEIVVNPGEKVPIDGIITEGNTTLNTSALTGESVPRDAKVGEEVISGCINMTGAIKLKTTKEFGDSTVSKILDLVENSSMKKSRSENFITKFARYYTPAVCYGALALAILPPIVRLIMGMSPDFPNWIIRALTFLVISCPCALVISIPLSFFGGIGCASSNGILVKGSNYLEELSKTKYIVFDKTGTLTKGVFEVNKIYPAKDFDEKTLLYFAAYAESGSSHPISQSLKKAYGEKIDLEKVNNIEEIAGHGVQADVDGKKVSAGNIKLMEKLGINPSDEHDEGTIVYVAVDGVYAGCITISDIIKQTTKMAIAELKKNGMKKTVMLTGDSKKVADKVATEIGIDMVRSELLPGDKVEQVEKLLAEKGDKEALAFVGDGINDAPVLSRADIGVAMGALGSDAAIEAADVVLMDDDPAKIALAMKISKRTLEIVRENIIFALAIKAICLVLGALGIANMWVAIFADVGVMVLAVLNATRALRIKL
ncbi:heavy metal translocating P-type ATPase [Eubacterium ventriosum]|uniref:heavy metal translocating P-type ATPase n=1 Tax=Eubacterium ventriosum TaxID=39496 RepID=UPI002673C051|nr:heavy metal translocating P-type ATPase [Eubacterium ventriosum]